MDQSDAYIVVGVLGKTRGVNGDIYVTLLTDFPGRFDNLKEIFVDERGIWQIHKIRSSKMIADRPVLRFEGINCKEDAARFTNRKLAVPRDQVVELPADTYYIFDLIGLEVIDESTNARVGEVVDVGQYPANDTYVIKMDDGRQMQVPAIDRFVKRVDLESRKVIIDTAGLV